MRCSVTAAPLSRQQGAAGVLAVIAEIQGTSRRYKILSSDLSSNTLVHETAARHFRYCEGS